jgi:N-acetylglucosamine kinase-like BadF-type ATPase
MAPLILAVDAGSSKVDAALIEHDGSVAVARRSRNVEHDGAGSASHLACVAASIDALAAGGTASLAEVGVFCVAGADYPQDDERITAWLRHRRWTAEVHLLNDTFAVLRSGTDRLWGVAVVCGHGTNCAGVAPDGRMLRFPAVGAISGDWGGGLDIGAAALWAAVRAEDGRGEDTLLASQLPAHFGLSRPSEVTEAIHFGRLSRWSLGDLPPLVFRVADVGDPVARRIVDRQADEVIALAATAIRRLALDQLDPHVVLGGGIFRTEDHRFHARIEQGLAAAAPRAEVRVPRVPPVVGAALLGLDRAGAPAEAAAHLRAELGEHRLVPTTG